MATQYKPILFSTEMVQAILEGRKTQTRRILKPQPKEGYNPKIYRGYDCQLHLQSRKSAIELEPHRWKVIQRGDILWVRETWQTTWNENKNRWDTIYKADGGYWIDDDGIMKWKPSIYMPKKRARIFLEVTNVKVERLQDISEEDAISEGIEIIHYAEPIVPIYKRYDLDEKKGTTNPKYSFQTIWQKINGKESWQSNPFVWVYEFKQVHHPKDFLNED